jgi:glycine cleavage system transcriptional repressor
VTGALLEAGMNILDLRSDVGGSEDRPIYVMQIDGESAAGLEPIEQCVSQLTEQGLTVRVLPIETMRG